MYSINYTHFHDTYALPRQVISLMSDTCSEIEIKVFLHLLQQGDKSTTPAQISEVLPYSILKIEQALRFWADRGFVSVQAAPVPAEVVPDKSQKATIRQEYTLSREEATDILGYDAAAQYLLHAAETIKGEPISPSEAIGYISIYKLQGMPVDELLLLLKYSQNIGKFNLKYIKKTAEAAASAVIITGCRGW